MILSTPQIWGIGFIFSQNGHSSVWSCLSQVMHCGNEQVTCTHWTCSEIITNTWRKQARPPDSQARAPSTLRKLSFSSCSESAGMCVSIIYFCHFILPLHPLLPVIFFQFTEKSHVDILKLTWWVNLAIGSWTDKSLKFFTPKKNKIDIKLDFYMGVSFFRKRKNKS